ncbi:MAG: DUF4202 domain-containing protein [Betaproteobacteria bacterium]|nr:DUF4202 domain-containing protein [Betaproteobacteria bacterium]
MTATSPRFKTAIERFDAANSEDPHRELVDGQELPRELAYARRMSAWLDRLAPDASEPLRLAARCQHIRRWTVPRNTYPMDREGYHRWRTALYQFHAETAGKILREAGYDDATIARVQALVRKERIKRDPEAQMLEDVVCLVFLENYFSEFAAHHDEAKLIGIVRKTWRKMSDQGHAAALKLDFPPEILALVGKALQEDKPAA